MITCPKCSHQFDLAKVHMDDTNNSTVCHGGHTSPKTTNTPALVTCGSCLKIMARHTPDQIADMQPEDMKNWTMAEFSYVMGYIQNAQFTGMLGGGEKTE